MRSKRFYAASLVLLVMAAFGVRLAWARTVAVGGYYAMPAWDQTLPASTRFIVLSNMNSEAVLDRETGLVWERAPHFSIPSWFEARSHCIDTAVGGRRGWRLPSIHELGSLADPTHAAPALPPGHPFINVFHAFWSATTDASESNSAWVFSFTDAGFASVGKVGSVNSRMWCVRGAMNADTY